ncbi:MAG: hypothetical protein JWP09_4 [Candidatus Taylorbacteria bacterium]|nr:hypothetical protein [Candidatus Taylorbacteria bacterium]
MKPKSVPARASKTVPTHVAKKKAREVVMKKRFETQKKIVPTRKKVSKRKRITFFSGSIDPSVRTLLRFGAIIKKKSVPYSSIIVGTGWRVLRSKRSGPTVRTVYQVIVASKQCLLEIRTSSRIQKGPINYKMVSASCRKCPWKK